MPTIAILNQKGGAGKTTIATNIAHALQLEGSKVLLVDSDLQGSATDWSEANEAKLLPVISLARKNQLENVKAVSGDYDWVVIDGAPQVKEMSAAAVKVADLVVIPVQPSPYDIWATADLVEIINARRDVTGGKPKAAFLISRAIRNTKLGKEITEALESYGLPVLKSGTMQRVAYPTTASEGKTVFEESSSEAAKEVRAIVEEIKEFIKHGA